MNATLGFYDTQQGTMATRWTRVSDLEVFARVFNSVPPASLAEQDEEDRVWDAFLSARLPSIDELAEAARREYIEGRTSPVEAASR